MPARENRKILENMAKIAEAEARRGESGRREVAAAPAAAPASAPAGGEADAGYIRVIKNALNGGEIGEEMGARFDQPRYQTGCHELLNMVPLPTGGVTKRPGFEFVGETRRGARLLPFVFSADEARVLELYPIGKDRVGVRVWKDADEGEQGAEGEDSGEEEARRGEEAGEEEGEKAGVEAIETGLRLPWRGEWLRGVSFCQSADVIYCAHPGFRPGKIMRFGEADWRYEEIRWTPSIRPPAWKSCLERGTRPQNNNSWNIYTYVITAVDEETGAESEAGDPWTLWGVPPLSSSLYIRMEIEEVEGAAEYRVYRKEAGVFGFIGRIVPSETPDLSFEDKNYAPDTGDTPPNWKDPFEKSYPAVVFMHQGRLGFAASDERPLTVWLSQAGNFESMAASTPPNDDDAVEATLAANQANRILWAVSDRSGLLLGTAGGEWELAGADGAVITPGNLSFAPQSRHGSAPGIPPVQAEGVLFAQRGGRVVREISYYYQDDRYKAADLSLLARHILGESPIVAWAWQPEPYGVLWMIQANGKACGLTWLREHDVVAWHRHSTAGALRDAVTIPAADGSWRLWVIREVEDGFHIERLRPFGAADFTDGRARSGYPARVVPAIADAQAPDGHSFLRVRKFNAVKFAVVNSAPFKIRVTSADAPPSPLLPVPARPRGFVRAALWHTPLMGGYRDNPRLEIIADDPTPLTILGFGAVLELAAESGSQK